MGSHRGPRKTPGCAWCERRRGLAGSQSSLCRPAVDSSTSFTAKGTLSCCVITADCHKSFPPLSERCCWGGDVCVSPHNCKEFIARVLFCNEIPFVFPRQYVLQPIRIPRIGVELATYPFSHVLCSRVNSLLTFCVPYSKYRAPFFWQTLIVNSSSAFLALILVGDFKELEDGVLSNVV